jgi:DMSO/TMAO reductase YedYZ heme-binding membrane subunit
MNKFDFRKLHRSIAPIVLFPLIITAITGMTYRVGKSWFNLSRDQVHFLMVIHEGEYLGKQLEPIYVLLNALGLLLMIVTGIGMLVKIVNKTEWFKALISRFSNPDQVK